MKFHELQALIKGMTRKEANKIADSAGVGKNTIAHIRKGRTENPRIETVEKLIRALSEQPKPRRRISTSVTPRPVAPSAEATTASAG
jgi:predicted transcriptional regulator